MIYIRDFFQTYTNDIINIIKNSPDRPYPIYLTTTTEIQNFLNDTEPFKGLFVIESQRYYSGALIQEIGTNNVNKIGFIITYEYGNIDYSRRPTLDYTIVYNFDYNPDIDHYGAMTIKLIDWFVNKHNEFFKNYKVDDCYVCSFFKYVSKPIYRVEGGITSFVRRSVVFNMKSIVCKET